MGGRKWLVGREVGGGSENVVVVVEGVWMVKVEVVVGVWIVV